MKSNLTISVIIPVYNAAQYLSQCLDSVIGQTYSSLEIICINDGSTDTSSEILHHYAAQDHRMIIIDQPNQGISATRNKGLSSATGDYILFVDSDDWIEEDTCKQAIAAIEETGADLVFWSYLREFGHSSKARLFPWDDGMVFNKTQIVCELQRRQCGLLGCELANPEAADSLVTVWGKLYSASVLRKSNVYFDDIRLIGTEDTLFNFYVLGCFEKAVYLKHPFYHYRKNISSFTRNYRPQLVMQWHTLFQRMRAYIESAQLPEIFTEALNNRIAMSILGLGLNVLCSSRPPMEQISMLRDLLRDPQYRQAVSKLTLRYFPIHWKVFYICAKLGFAPGIYGLLKAIQYFISRGTV